MAQPFKTILCVDAESRWSSKPTDWCPEAFTLSKMTTENYIRSPLFKAFGFCIHEVGASTPIQWYKHSELEHILSMYDWSTTALLAHNAQFDVSILSMLYGIKPCFVFDTLSMARALRGVEVGNSLMKLAEDFGLPPKGKAVHSTDGLWELTPTIEKELADYCKHDVALCEALFGFLMLRVDPVTRESAGPYPTKELRLIDMTVRMYSEPELVLDIPMLEKALVEETDRLQAALTRAGVEQSTLASNDKFSEILIGMGVTPPTKTSKATGKLIPALAKSDALFQALLNGDNEDVAILCEARLKVRSTLERTRAQRFIEIAGRGALPVPLSYYGAAVTGRWAAAKGSNINLQNMKRGSFLRKAIMAPEDHVLCVGDLSQIEPRVLAWLADYEPMLDIFRAGGDPYATFGSQMFSIPGMTKDTHPLLRQSAKSALLGCFGGDTLVLTQRGYVPIVDVLDSDTTWDGEAWTTHQGVIAQGEKEVLTSRGVSATSDHEILTERGWVEWSEALQSSSLFQSALSLAILPASGGTGTGQCSTRTCGVPAGGKGLYTAPTSSTGAARGAGLVHARKPSRPGGRILGTTLYAPKGSTATGSLTASARSLAAALTQTATSIRTMVGGALRCTQRGLQTVLSSFDTSSVLTDGISRSYSLTGATTSAGMNRATFASAHVAKTARTSDGIRQGQSRYSTSGSPPLRQRIQTYDIAMAGPRNRYTILTDDGPIIVHNCGYQLGWASFAAQLLVGFLGAPPVCYTKAEARQLGVTSQDVADFMASQRYMEQMAEIPHICTDAELLIHCLAAKAIVEKYRSAASPVVDFWTLLGNLLESSLVGGQEYTHKEVLHFRKGEIELVNGMTIRYPDLQRTKDERGYAVYSYSDGKKRTKIYPGKICNNVTQATARIIMSDGMLRIQKRHPVKGTVHDEALWLAQERIAEESYKWGLSQMVIVPKWMPGIPLNADGGFHRRYGMAKN